MGEPVRLATFLRERCARNQYGLRYLNPEQTLILIPWPVVPRDNEESPPGFQMFQVSYNLFFFRRTFMLRVCLPLQHRTALCPFCMSFVWLGHYCTSGQLLGLKKENNIVSIFFLG